MANRLPDLITPFRFWSQKVLPTVYEDSISYYEVLGKTVDKINEVINTVNGQTEHIQGWEIDFTNTVREWETEVENALDDWKNGTETDITNRFNEILADIEGWEEDYTASMNEWKGVFEEEYADLKDEVEQIADDAETAKNAAAASATAAAGSATDAAGYATTAAGSATEAATSAATVSDSVTQIAKNTTDISEIKSAFEDGYLKIPIEISDTGKYVKYSDGTINASSTADATDYIDLSNYGIIKYTRTTTTSNTANAGLAFYDANKTYMFGIQSVTNAEYVGYVIYETGVPLGAKYARFTIYNNIETPFELFGISNVNIDEKYTESYLSLKYGYYSTQNSKFQHDNAYPHRRAYGIYSAKKGDYLRTANGYSFQVAETNADFSTYTLLTTAYIKYFTFDEDKFVIITVKSDTNNDDFGTENALDTSLVISGIPESRLNAMTMEQKISDYFKLSIGVDKYPKNLFNPAQVDDSMVVLFQTGQVVASANTRHASEFIPVVPNKKYTLNFSFYSTDGGIAFYDSDKNYITGMRQCKYYSTDPSQMHINFDFVVPDGCYYCKFSMTDNIISVNNVVFTEYVQKIMKDDNEIPDNILLNYSGGKISLYNKYYYNEYMQMTHTLVSGSSNQGGARYDKYYFQFEDSLRAVHVYDLETKTLVQNIVPTSISGLHCNNVNFGVEKYDSNDMFPLIYAASASLDNVYVFRITGDVGEWTLTLVQTISWDSSDGIYYTSMAIDKENKWLIQYGFINNSTQPDNDNAIKINVFDLPKLSEGDITISDNTKKHSNIIPFEYYYQGTICVCGKLYITFGNQETPNKILVIDATTGTIINLINLDGTQIRTLIGEEPEGCFEYNGNLFIAGCKTANSGSNKIIEIYFK